jgi:hypothetical protein
VLLFKIGFFCLTDLKNALKGRGRGGGIFCKGGILKEFFAGGEKKIRLLCREKRPIYPEH